MMFLNFQNIYTSYFFISLYILGKTLFHGFARSVTFLIDLGKFELRL